MHANNSKHNAHYVKESESCVYIRMPSSRQDIACCSMLLSAVLYHRELVHHQMINHQSGVSIDVTTGTPGIDSLLVNGK